MKRPAYILLVFSLLFALAGCGSKEEKVAQNESANEAMHSGNHIRVTEAQFSKTNMQLDVIKEIPFSIGIQTTGLIDVPPQNRAMVTAMMGGYIKNTPLLIGDVVKKGQMLLTLENPDFITLQQKYLEASQQLSYLKSEYERQQTLVAENISSQKKFLKAESDYKTTLASYNGLQKRLSMLNISHVEVEKGNITSVVTMYAPIAGSVTKVYISKGMYVSPATEIMEIVDNDHIHLELNVFEKDILQVKKDQKIRFEIPEASDTIYEATVHLIGTAIDQNRTIRVHGHLNDESKNTFLTGMFVEASIITATKEYKALPETAIVESDGKPHVLVLAAKTKNLYEFELVAVTTGEKTDGYISITNADQFKTTDQFLTKGGFYLVGESAGHEH